MRKFLLYMGKTVNILDIANDLINLYNLITKKRIVIYRHSSRRKTFATKEQMATSKNRYIF